MFSLRALCWQFGRDWELVDAPSRLQHTVLILCLDPESEQTKDATDAPTEDTPKTSDDVMPKDISELEGDGDANINSPPDGTDPEPPKIAQNSENDAEDSPEAPTEGTSKSDEPKDVQEKEVPTSPDTLAADEPAKDDDVEPKIDEQEPKQEIDAQDNDFSKENKVEEIPANEDKPAEPSKQESDLPTESTAEEESNSAALDANDPKDEGSSERDLPERPKPETEAETPSDEPFHTEAQESPVAEQDSTPPQTSDVPKGSLLDGAEPSQVEEAEKYQTGNDKGMIQSLYNSVLAFVHISIVSNILYLLRCLSAPVESKADENEGAPKESQSSQPLAPQEEFDDASVPEPTSDYEEVMGDSQDSSKYGEFLQRSNCSERFLTSLSTENPASSKESSELSQTKQKTNTTLADTLNSATETVADARKNLLDTATTTGKDATGSVADAVKDSAPETGKTYTESLTDIVKGVTDKAADLNQNYQDQATDGTKEGRQGVMGLVDAAVSYISPLKGDSGFVVDKETLKEQE